MRRKTKKIKVGPLFIGGDAPITIQSMTNTKTKDVDSTLNQISSLVNLGCEIVRIALPDFDSVPSFQQIVKKSKEMYPNVPLVADIHFDYKLAIEAIKAGVDKIRINPGNIGGKEPLKKLVDFAKDYDVAMRVGVNGGSLEQDLVDKYGSTPNAAVKSALRYISWLEEMDFTNLVVSLKFSDVLKMVEANRLFSKMSDYPLHLGVTEAGTLFSSTVASSIGIGSLLLDGIGDTIRVSITGPPENEIKVAKEILQATKTRLFHPILTVCPTCGRTQINIPEIAEEVEKRLKEEKIPPMHIAVMGCVVNGIGEGKEADVGLAGGKGMGVIFRKGKIVRRVKEAELVDALFDEIHKFMEEKND